MINNDELSKKPQSSTWDEVALKYDIVLKNYEKEFGQYLYELFKNLTNDHAKVIELGSGSGHLSGYLAKKGFETTLFDFSEVALEKAKDFYISENVEGNFIKGDLLSIEDDYGEYDIVWNSGVMEHFDDKELLSAFYEMKKIQSQYYVFFVPNPESIPYLLYRYKLMKEDQWSFGTEYLRDNYEEILNLAEFNVIQTVYYGKEYSKEHLEYSFGPNAVDQDLLRLLNNNMLPESSYYLKGFIVQFKGDNEVTKFEDKNDFTVSERTRFFDYSAKMDGQIDKLKMEKEKCEKELLIIEQEKIEEVNKLKEMLVELDQLKKENLTLQTSVQIKSDEFQSVKKALEEEVAYARFLLKNNNDEILQLKQNLDKYNEMRYWKLAHKIYRLMNSVGILKIYRNIKPSSLKRRIKRMDLSDNVNKGTYRKELNDIIKENKNKPIIIFPELMDWNIPLYQRPQHIAMNLGEEEYLYFYCTPNIQYENVKGFKKIGNGTYLTNQQNLLFEEVKHKKIIHIYATDTRPVNPWIMDSYNKGDLILYEFVDEIHEDIQGTISLEVREKHEKFLRDENVIVVATADKLITEAQKYRKKNIALVTNGVDCDHFSKEVSFDEIPKEIKGVALKNKPVIGYFGAFARWFDYELIKKLALERPDYEILLIGWDYDGSLKNEHLDIFDNITVVGPIDYAILPKYASIFTVSIIPFVINDVTEATSPIKLFEYMALGKAIVTTDMPECRKYESVQIGKTHEEFIQKVDLALKLNEEASYKKLLFEEAMQNTWKAKAKDISKVIRENF